MPNQMQDTSWGQKLTEPPAQRDDLFHIRFRDNPPLIAQRSDDHTAVHWYRHGYRHGDIEVNQDFHDSIEQTAKFNEARARSVIAKVSNNGKQDEKRWDGNLQGKHDHGI